MTVPILLVDDRAHNLRALEELLRSPGYEIVRAASGPEALRELLRRDFAVVLLDVEMPGMDGVETARLVRSRERSRDTPIIFLTASDARTRDGYALGAADYLQKPVEPETLRAKVAVFAELFLSTQRARALAAELRARADANARYAALVESLRDAVVGEHPNGTVASWNPAAERIYGFREDEVVGRPTSDRVPPERWEQEAAVRARLERGERVEPYETARLRRDGGVVEVEVTAAPILGDDGGVVGWSAVERDITARRRDQDALRESDERFRQAMRSAPIGMALVGPAGEWLDVNPALCRILRYTEDELRALTFQDITHPDDLHADLHHMERLVAGETHGYEMEKRYLRSDGTPVWVLLSVSLVRTGAGAPRYFIAQIQDITQRRAEEGAIAEEARYLESVVRTQRDITLAGLDPARVMQAAADRTRDMTGADGAVIELAEGEEMVYRAASGTLAPHVGMRIRIQGSLSGLCARTGEAVWTDDSDTDPRVDREAARRVGARSMLLVPLLHERESVGVLKVISALPDAFIERDFHTLELVAGLLGGALGQAAAFERNRTLLAELDRSNRELEDFAYVASHDLQEPLRKIQAFGDRLAGRFGEALGEQGMDYVARMQGAAARMQALIQDLLEYSRASSRELVQRPVELDAVARGVVSDLSERVRATGGTVEVAPLPALRADPTQMRQLLQNLIGNALKFHREGVPPVVRVSAEGDAGWTRITVRDNGIGFDPRYADKIFTPFQRLHPRTRYEGTGMGLAICRRIAERHGGHIDVHSAPGEGTAFVVALPTPASDA